jgi:hypothetical protein
MADQPAAGSGPLTFRPLDGTGGAERLVPREPALLLMWRDLLDSFATAHSTSGLNRTSPH